MDIRKTFVGNAAKNASSNASKSFMNKMRNTGSSVFSTTRNVIEAPFHWVGWGLLYFIVAVVVSYLTVMTTKYLATRCPHKRNWFSYIFRFCFSDVCERPEHRVTTRVHWMPKPKPQTANSTSPPVEVNVKKLEKPEQVFHIGNQDYTFKQAKCKCASYNAKLATYGQIVDAYNKGADWCSYGWSEGQTAYYPTQKCNWLKKSKKERAACGKPGVNGGFFSDPYLKFGVNCYGKKPEGEIVKMKHESCKQDFCAMPQNYNANHRLDTDEIAPFNENKWSQ